jgi:20S proteasome alpha/beta subunit
LYDITNEYSTDVSYEDNTTLILGARCVDGVALVADTKITTIYDVGRRYSYGKKITGELEGILTGFSGHKGVFEVFAMTLRDYVKSTTETNREKFLAQYMTGLRKEPDFSPSLEQVKFQITRIQNDFYNRNKKHRYRVLMGVSGQHLDGKSMLYYFDTDGSCMPESEPVAIGHGSPYATYFLRLYWKSGQTTMNQFAQLGDFIIRYVSNDKIMLDDSVGLEKSNPYPQIIYIPDNVKTCGLDKNGKQRLDCSPKKTELIIFKSYSNNKLKTLQNRSF